jgi:membrane fusion protein (multidrug efflux system)
VAVVRAHPQAVPLTRDLVGRLAPVRTADVRARVAGILLKRLYREGSEVREGQPLFQIDPAPLKAALDAALAALAQAQANATNAHVLAARNRELVPSGLISRSDRDNSDAAERSTAAQVKQAEANVETARINLGYATVTAPIAGRSGQQRVTEGALVGQGEATLLTTVDQIDPLYVNFDQPASEVAQLRHAQSSGDVTLVQANKAQVQVIQPDGTTYAHLGTLDFTDVTVDPATGTLALRGVVPNPDRQLLPGMFVNVHLMLGTQNRAYLISQDAVRRDSNGAYVVVVGEDGKVLEKRVQADVMSGTNWVVTSGIAENDQVVVSGVDKVHPGMSARAVPYGAPPASGVAAAGEHAS